MIVTRTPFRISFVGGGTDFPEVYSNIPYGCCVGMAINKYMWIILNRRFDTDIRVSYSKTEISKEVNELHHDIARECLKYTDVKNGIEVVSVADVPAGTGLGSSSAYTVGLLNALYTLAGYAPSPAVLAAEAMAIELNVLNKNMGVQDAYMSAYGGLIALRMSKKSIEVMRMEPNIAFLNMINNWVTVLDTGDRHLAEVILKEQIFEWVDHIDEYKHLTALAEHVISLLKAGVPPINFGPHIAEGWNIKKRLSPAITNCYIDSLFEKMVFRGGVIGAKLCGAGAAGFLFIIHWPDKKKDLLDSVGLKELPIKFEPMGSMATILS